MAQEHVLKKKSIAILGFVLGALLLFLLAQVLVPDFARAYYERNPVTISVSSSAQVKANDTTSIACKVTPESEKQLPGCGMEECPQSCGDGCLNSEGWCTCAGTGYETYKTAVSVSSSASSVATGSYSNGVLKIKGISQGSATLTLTAKLSKHLDATATVHVTVAGYTAPSESSGNDNAGGQQTNGGAAGKVNKKDSGKSASVSSPSSTKKLAKQSKNGVAITSISSSNAFPKKGAKKTVADDSAMQGEAENPMDVGFDQGLSLAAFSSGSLPSVLTVADEKADELPVPVLIVSLAGLVALVLAIARLKRTKKM